MASKSDKKKAVLEEIRVILIGKTGAGKSYLGNALLGREEFESSVFAESETTKCVFGKQEITSKSRKYILKVIDTPGLMDTRLPEEETCGELVKCISLTLPGPHLFVIVVPIGRFTDEEFEVVVKLKREFDDKLMDFSLVVFSHGSKLRNISIEDYLKRAPDALKQIVKECNNRYAVIGDDRDKSFQKSVQDITNLIADQHKSGYYTNDMFKKAEENKKKIIASLDDDKNEQIKKLQTELNNLKLANYNREDRESEIIKELQKIKETSSAEKYDTLVITDESVSQKTFSAIAIFGGLIAAGAGIFTLNPVLASAGVGLTIGGMGNVIGKVLPTQSKTVKKKKANQTNKKDS